jgi:hypothetical protein
MRTGAVACGGCGTGPIRDGARFCDACGAGSAGEKALQERFTFAALPVVDPTVTVLVEPLLQRGAAGDVHAAQEGGDQTGYRERVDRYRATATACGFQGHMAMAEEMR